MARIIARTGAFHGILSASEAATYSDARRRGYSSVAAHAIVAADRAAAMVLDDVTEASELAGDFGPYGGPSSRPLAVWHVDPDALAAVTGDPRTAGLAGYVYDADGERIVESVRLPAGARALVYVYPDTYTDGEGWELDDETRAALAAGGVDFVGLSAVVTLADGREGESAIWAVETGDHWPGTTEGQSWHVVPGIIADALASLDGREA